MEVIIFINYSRKINFSKKIIKRNQAPMLISDIFFAASFKTT